MKTKQIPREILKQTGYALVCVNDDVLKNAPVGKVQHVEFFNVGKRISCSELDKEYADRGLQPANLNSTAAVCDKHDFVATQWKDADGNYCYLSFSRWSGERDVSCDRDNDDGWYGPWWFAGVPVSGKSTKKSDTENKSLRALDLIAEIEDRLAALKALV